MIIKEMATPSGKKGMANRKNHSAESYPQRTGVSSRIEKSLWECLLFRLESAVKRILWQLLDQSINNSDARESVSAPCIGP